MNANLLLVEDHEPTRIILARILTNYGYNVACAKSGTEAVKLATTSPFDLVVMDHGLPDGNGCDYMKTLHDTFNLNGIALTAKAYASDERMSREAGFRAHLSKPVDARRIVSAIESALRGGDGADKPAH
jgi:CheY-like chemotaxis protein